MQKDAISMSRSVTFMDFQNVFGSILHSQNMLLRIRSV